MQKCGAYLKSIREEKGFSIEEASKATKLSSAVLRALEEGRLDNVDRVYLKGFLKLYCRFLGLVWEDFIKEYPLSSASQNAPKPAIASRRPKEKKPFFAKYKKAIVVVLAVVCLFLSAVLLGKALVWAKKNLSRIKLPSPSVIKAPAKSSPAKSPASSKKPSPQSKEKAKPFPKSAPAKSLAPAVPVKKEVTPKSINLVVRVQEDNFIKVKVDGQMVYQGLLHKGKAESWSAKEKIELSIANAGAVTCELDGKVLPPLGRRGESLKNILVDSQGMKIL